ncbi:type II toxin-antitoxin system PemK/MazF family toxin [Microbacterium sp. NPDC057650]|uniref:type II toxin-antitoxin system PemK/MazF family toxin n=1 Tax=unclassified Microbacterium TaxID=2609290 RepID=UPI0036701BE5
MSSTNGILSTLLEILQKILRKEATVAPVAPRLPDRSEHGTGEESGRMPGSETIRVDPDRIRDLRVSYAPQRDGAPDAGEVIWTWVPYEENDGRGKDRPVLVIGRHAADRVYAVRMTSKPHDGDRDYLSIGSGGWDGQGRESWVDIEQLYSVHDRRMRREAAVLDKQRYKRVVAALMRRYGWARES